MFSMLPAIAFSTASTFESITLFLMGDTSVCVSVNDSILNSIATDTLHLQSNQNATAHSIIDTIKDNQKKKKRVTAFCAFPFPLGFVAAHRIMLGTKPWVPIVYVATFGGCFGLLPLIDFCVILFSKDITQYENNPNIFMWIKETGN